MSNNEILKCLEITDVNTIKVKKKRRKKLLLCYNNTKRYTFRKKVEHAFYKTKKNTYRINYANKTTDTLEFQNWKIYFLHFGHSRDNKKQSFQK